MRWRQRQRAVQLCPAHAALRASMHDLVLIVVVCRSVTLGCVLQPSQKRSTFTGQSHRIWTIYRCVEPLHVPRGFGHALGRL
jgi:hypothetical protein